MNNFGGSMKVTVRMFSKIGSKMNMTVSTTRGFRNNTRNRNAVSTSRRITYGSGRMTMMRNFTTSIRMNSSKKWKKNTGRS